MSYSSFHSLKHQVSNLDSALFFLVFCWNIIALQCYISFYSIAKWSHTYQFSHSAVSNSLWPHGLWHARLPCPSPTPGAYSKSCPSCQWCHPTISSSVAPFSSCLQSFPASGSFPMSWLFASGGQSVGASASASVLSMNSHDWFPLG